MLIAFAVQPASRINCNIAFGQFALSALESHVESTVTVLIGILRDVPHIDYERSLAWSGKLIKYRFAVD